MSRVRTVLPPKFAVDAAGGQALIQGNGDVAEQQLAHQRLILYRFRSQLVLLRALSDENLDALIEYTHMTASWEKDPLRHLMRDVLRAIKESK